MYQRHLSVLSFCTVLAALPAAALQAQSTDSSMKKPMMHDMPAAGMIHGSGSHMAAGTIHIVGAMPTQKIHFTSEFKTDASSDVHAVLSNDMMAGAGSVDLGEVKNGDQLIAVPQTADAHHFSHLLILNNKTRMVVASTMIPGGKMDGMMSKDGMKKDSTMSKPY